MKNFFYVFFILGIVVSCKEDTQVNPKLYNSAQKIDNLSKEAIQEYWGQNDTANQFILHDVEVVRITYPSVDLQGNTIEASGAILIPKGVDNPSVISLQHATFFEDSEAPSENGGFSVVSRKSIFAASGRIVVLPDYLGYGTTKEYVHPYHHAQSLAQHSYDMLQASLSYLKNEKTTNSNTVTIMGYSEGAYASLALVKKIEEENLPVEIEGISLGSGAYNLSKTVEYLVSSTEQSVGCLPCNAFFLYSYHQVYAFTLPLSEYFNVPYYSVINNGLFNGTYNASQIAEVLPLNTLDLLNPAFAIRYVTGQESELITTLQENNLHNYVPKSPMLITHGTKDSVAPFFNSEEYVLNAKNENVDIEFIPLENINHFDGIYQWGMYTLQWLNETQE